MQRTGGRAASGVDRGGGTTIPGPQKRGIGGTGLLTAFPGLRLRLSWAIFLASLRDAFPGFSKSKAGGPHSDSAVHLKSVPHSMSIRKPTHRDKTAMNGAPASPLRGFSNLLPHSQDCAYACPGLFSLHPYGMLSPVFQNQRQAAHTVTLPSTCHSVKVNLCPISG